MLRQKGLCHDWVPPPTVEFGARTDITGHRPTLGSIAQDPIERCEIVHIGQNGKSMAPPCGPARRSPRATGSPARSGCRRTRRTGPGPGLLWPQRRRRRRDRCGLVVEGGGPAGARSGHALGGTRLGPQGSGLDPPRPRRPRPGWCRDRLCVREQELLARRHRHQRERPRVQPCRPADGPAVEVAAGLWR
jgi:hypothetical protein